MLYCIRQYRPMVLARIEFKQQHATKFIDSSDGVQTVIEQTFDSVDELIEVLREFEPFIKDCTAVINGKMIQLSSFKAK